MSGECPVCGMHPIDGCCICDCTHESCYPPQVKKNFLDKNCKQCGCSVCFNEGFDAFYCPECNIWLENICDDASCFFCPQRPERPLKKYKKNLNTKFKVHMTKKTESIQQQQASPELTLFFSRLLQIKKELKEAADDGTDERFTYFYEQLHELFKAVDDV